MAIMHPSSIENYKYTESEKEFYEALRDQLSDKYHVFYSVRWFETDEEDKRVDSESDFLIFDPNFGFLAIEVKGGIGIEIKDDVWTLELSHGEYRTLNCSPYLQAEKSMRHFYKYFDEEYNQQFNGVYGFAVAFPRFTVNEPLTVSSPLELTIDAQDMDSLGKRINDIFHYWKRERNMVVLLSQDHRIRFLNCINKQISISAAAGSLIPIKEKEFSKIDFTQESVLELLQNHKQVQIVGGAGTGKTFIAVKKLKRDFLKAGTRVLFVCKREELADYVRTMLPENPRIVCKDYNSIIYDFLGEAAWDLEENVNGNISAIDQFSHISKVERFDTIVVDEAQDFDSDMALTVRALLKSQTQSSLYVFCDNNQNIFGVTEQNPFHIEEAPYFLRYNIRNTGAIYEFAVDKTGLGQETFANGIEGVSPEIFQYTKKSQALKDLNGKLLRLIQREFVPTNSFAIITDVSFESSILEGIDSIGPYKLVNKRPDEVEDNEISVCTVDQFKGLEANVVIYLAHEFRDLGAGTDKNRDYVALTRARYYLFVMKTIL